MSKESFVITSVTGQKLEHVHGNIFCTSMLVKKDSGVSQEERYRQAETGHEAVLFQFYSPLGYMIKAPIVDLSVSSYGTEYPYDVLDIYFTLTPEQLAFLTPPQPFKDFGY